MQKSGVGVLENGRGEAEQKQSQNLRLRWEVNIVGDMRSDDIADLVYEIMLLSRLATQGIAPYKRQAVLDRSATILLARLTASGPMSVAGLAEAFGLDISTVHRQLAAAMKHGLIEKINDPVGGSAKLHRATDYGEKLLEEELGRRAQSIAHVTRQWSDSTVRELAQLLERFNKDVEFLRQQPWPR